MPLRDLFEMQRLPAHVGVPKRMGVCAQRRADRHKTNQRNFILLQTVPKLEPLVATHTLLAAA